MRLTYLFTAALALTPLFAAEPNFKEGSWYINSTTEMTGMPMGDSSMPFESVECLTRDNMIPSQQSDSQQQCTISDEKITASSVSWSIQCPTANGTGSIRYNGDSFDGKTEMQIVTPMGEINMVTTMHGQYQGPCH